MHLCLRAFGNLFRGSCSTDSAHPVFPFAHQSNRKTIQGRITMTESIKPKTLSNLPSEAIACSNASILNSAGSTGCRDRFVDKSGRACSGVDDSLLIDVEALLTQANRDAVRVSNPIDNSSPLAAKAILRRVNDGILNPSSRIVRADLAKSLAHTLAHLS